jgi:hypothetical protein
MVAHRKVDPAGNTPRPKGALTITNFARFYGVHPCTVWRALRDGRLEYVLVGKKKLVLHPEPRRDSATA